MVLSGDSGQTNNIIEYDFICSTDCMHVVLANLLFEIMMIAYMVFA